VRADLADWRAEAAELTDVKLLVLGNGRSGKTQLTRRLRGEAFQAEWNSTHGVLITTANLPAPDGGPETPLSIWDFGGQDIYHGTHALFVRSRAVFMLVWSDGTERDRRPEYAHQGITFRNHPLAYWVDYARHLAHAESPTLIVQTKCDQDAERRADVPEQALKALGFVLEKHASAVLPDGLDELKAALRQAIRVLRDRQGIIRVGAGRLRVKQKIEALRNPDGTWPEEHRLLKRATFDAWCIEEGGKVSSPDALLTWLHNSGAVFHPRELLQDQIVLDHTWALNAIYAVFDRTSCYPRLLRDGGIFDRARLEELVWGKGARPQDPAWTGYTVDDQRLFLKMMRSCGICFVYRKGQRGYEDDDDTEYVAPDLLPVRDEIQLRIEAQWGAGPASASATFAYPLLHPGVMRGVMGRIGDRAGIHALYWRGGLLVYEATTRSHAMIEAVVVPDGWAGTVTVQTKHGQSAALHDLLAGWVAEENSRLGLQPEVTIVHPDTAGAKRTGGRGTRRAAGFRDATAASRSRRAKRPPRDGDPAEVPMEPTFTPAPPPSPQYAVSYAWNDKTGGPEREDVVNKMEAAAAKRGIKVLRDKSVLKHGDRISEFMHEIARSERVFVFLSAKYLQSYNCMAELYEVWRRCEDEKAFRQRVRVYQLPDGDISDFVRRQDVRKWWAAKHQAMKDAAGGADDVSTADQDELRRTGHIARHASDILALIKDTIGIRNIDDLIQIEFPDEPRPPVA
jgi:internalin A